jgi:hypothetical protein
MKFVRLFAHLFVPHESNNQKAKILHPSSILQIAIFLIAFQVVLGVASKTFPRVLGYAANISPAEVVRLTNERRAANGLSALTQNSQLDSAALAKGNDMLAKGYWAHFAPDGTSPWTFFTNFGYKYRYAGENLARDFSNPADAVNAWMNSPTHKDNILNANYREIGIGVVEGNLSGADTTIIVQFFGTPQTGDPSIPVVKAKEVPTTTSVSSPKATVRATVSTPAPTIIPTPSPTPSVISTPAPTQKPSILSLISPFQTTKGITMGVTGVLLLVLSIDLIVVKRKRIARIGGRTLAHLAFLGMILAVILILKAGQII